MTNTSSLATKVRPKANETYNASSQKDKIQHIIVIIQENHAFDNYFGTYPGAIGIPANECMPTNSLNLSQGCVKPFLVTDPTFPSNYSNSTISMPNGFCHSYPCAEISWDQGKMDGFIKASNTPLVMGYYNNQTIPYYWNLARNYTLDDMFFQSVLGYSLPNHWYAIAGRAPIESILYINQTELESTFYLRDAANITTIADLMERNGSISWKYYDFPFYVSYNVSTVKYNLWNPFASQPRNYLPENASHFVMRTQILTDIADRNLPNVSYVIPSTEISEHPPYNITYGMYWTSSVIDAVMNSSYWNHTVIIVTWDDYGGEFDTISPPQVDHWGYGPRVPALVISPYSRSGYIDNTTYAFESILKLIEWRYNIPPLTKRDTIANNIVDSLNLNQTPARPHLIPLTNEQRKLIAPYLNETPTED
jgi:phospholipase C